MYTYSVDFEYQNIKIDSAHTQNKMLFKYIWRTTKKLPPYFNQTEISDSNLLYIGFEKKTVQKLSRVLTWMPHTCTEARYYELASDY